MKFNKIVFIGLGVMGYPMAGFLAKKFTNKVWVWNRSGNVVKKWAKEYKANYDLDLSKVLKDADIIITCLNKDENFKELFFNNNTNCFKKGAIFIDHTTTSYNLAVTLNDFLVEKNVRFIDAPISGGEIGAKNGTLSIMVGGYIAVLNILKDVLSCYSKKITHIGPVGHGQLAKMVNQICITGIIQSLSEAIVFAEKENMNVQAVIEAISGGAANSWQLVNNAKTMYKREFDFGFAVNLFVKDLGYCLDRAKENGTNLEFTEKIYQNYKKLMPEHSRKDTSSLILLENNNK